MSSTRNGLVLGIEFYDIIYLPINVDAIFPNLIAQHAGSCNIKQVAKPNFSNLSKLKVLVLDSNQLETVPSDAFEDLILLEKLWLSEKINLTVFN
jgi:Leucine-rich repeat (LRR) protein